MTLDEIRRSDKLLLTCADIGEALGIDPQGIRVWAQQQPDKLGFPVMRYGKHGCQVRIPRMAFLRFMEGRQ